MTTTLAFVTALGTLVVLAGVAGALYAVLRTSAQDATIKRLREENEDYLRRLNYLEPRVDLLEKRNEVLEHLHNPAKAIGEIASQVGDLAVQEATNHRETIGVLDRIDGHLGGAR